MISSQSLTFKEYLWGNIPITPAPALLFVRQPFSPRAAVRAPCLTGPRLPVLQTRKKCQLELDAACSPLSAALMPLAHPQHQPQQPGSATTLPQKATAAWAKAVPPMPSLPPSHLCEAMSWCNPNKSASLFDPVWQLTKSHCSCWHWLVFHLPRLRIKVGTTLTRKQGCL